MSAQPKSFVKEEGACLLDNSIIMADIFINNVDRDKVEEMINNDQEIRFVCDLDKNLKFIKFSYIHKYDVRLSAIYFF